MRLSDLDNWAQHHHGLITLHASGFTNDTWRRAIGTGSLIELHRHVARLPGSPATPIQRIQAAVLAAGRGASASHRSAAVLWGIVPPDLGGHIHITMSARSRHPRLAGVVIHRPTDRQRLDPLHRHGIECTDVIRTLCDLGADDIALVRPAVAAALIRHLVDVETLTRAVTEHSRPGRGGIPALRSAVAALTAASPDDITVTDGTAAASATDSTVADKSATTTGQTLKRNSITSPSWAT